MDINVFLFYIERFFYIYAFTFVSVPLEPA